MVLLMQVVLENNTNATDSDGVPAHSINAIVLGGSDQDIATTIQKKIVGGGCGTFGSESATLTNYRGRDRVINFDRPTIKNIIVVVNVVRVKSERILTLISSKSRFHQKNLRSVKNALAGRLYCITNDGTLYPVNHCRWWRSISSWHS